MLEPEAEGVYGAIVLAAGASTPMGCVKQTLPWKGKTLLQHVVDELRLSELAEVVVVLGANREDIEKQVTFDGVDVVHNDQWEKGMASSVVTGLNHLLAKGLPLKAVMIVLSDQPLLGHVHFNSLKRIHANSVKGIVASSYAGVAGVPVLFDRRFFDELLRLSGEQGARALLVSNLKEVETVDAGERGIDLDTREKYEDIYDRYGRQ